MFAKCSLFALTLSANGYRKRSKHGLFVFPPKKTLIWRRHCSIGQSCCSMTSKRSFDWLAWSFFFLPEHTLYQPKATRVCIRSINQSNRSISVRSLFLFCSRVFISRSYKNRSIGYRNDMPVPVRTFASWIPLFFTSLHYVPSPVVTLILYTFFHLLWHFSYVFDRRFYNDSELPQSIRVPSYFRIKVNHQKSF